jgi:hypothetical protein
MFPFVGRGSKVSINYKQCKEVESRTKEYECTYRSNPQDVGGTNQSEGPVSKSSYFLGDPPPDPRFLAEDEKGTQSLTRCSSWHMMRSRATGQHQLSWSI